MPRKLIRTWLFFITCACVGYLAMATVAAPAPKPIAESAALGHQPPDNPAADITDRVSVLKSRHASSSLFERCVSSLGIFVLLGLCALMSDNRKKINWKLVAWGVGLQFVFGFLF